MNAPYNDETSRYEDYGEKPKTATDLYREAVQADKAWSEQLKKTFGKSAGDARYGKRGEGEPGSALNRAFTAWVSASIAWRGTLTQEVARGN